MNPSLATLRRLFDAVCLKFCESNDPLMEASPLPEWWAKCDPGAARQQCTMSALFTLHTVNSVQKMYKMLWAKTEALYILHIVQIVHRIFTECTKNVESGVGGPGKQKDWSFRQQGGKERSCKQNISHFSSPRSPLILRLKMCTKARFSNNKRWKYFNLNQGTDCKPTTRAKTRCGDSASKLCLLEFDYWLFIFSPGRSNSH